MITLNPMTFRTNLKHGAPDGVVACRQSCVLVRPSSLTSTHRSAITDASCLTQINMLQPRRLEPIPGNLLVWPVMRWPTGHCLTLNLFPRTLFALRRRILGQHYVPTEVHVAKPLKFGRFRARNLTAVSWILLEIVTDGTPVCRCNGLCIRLAPESPGQIMTVGQVSHRRVNPDLWKTSADIVLDLLFMTVSVHSTSISMRSGAYTACRMLVGGYLWPTAIGIKHQFHWRTPVWCVINNFKQVSWTLWTPFASKLAALVAFGRVNRIGPLNKWRTPTVLCL